MTAVSQNKTALHKERRTIKMLQAHLPALDMKRRGLMIARAAEVRRSQMLSAEWTQATCDAGAHFPMLAQVGIAVETLLGPPVVTRVEERILGVRVPTIIDVTVEIRSIPRHVFAHWVEPVVQLARRAVVVRVLLKAQVMRIAILDGALIKTTQRLNLLEKLLIPEAQKRVKDIELRLSEQERAAVVMAKVAKAKRERVLS
jgi:V/A-type H+-transporting ATPase subunit D